MAGGLQENGVDRLNPQPQQQTLEQKYNEILQKLKKIENQNKGKDLYGTIGYQIGQLEYGFDQYKKNPDLFSDSLKFKMVLAESEMKRFDEKENSAQKNLESKAPNKVAEKANNFKKQAEGRSNNNPLAKLLEGNPISRYSKGQDVINAQHEIANKTKNN